MKIKVGKSNSSKSMVAASVSVPHDQREDFEKKKADLLSKLGRLGIKSFSALVRAVIIDGEIRDAAPDGKVYLSVRLK